MVDSTTSSLRCARPGSWIRSPSLTSAGSRDVPLRVTDSTEAVMASMNELLPGVAVKSTVVCTRKVSGSPVSSSATR